MDNKDFPPQGAEDVVSEQELAQKLERARQAVRRDAERARSTSEVTASPESPKLSPEQVAQLRQIDAGLQGIQSQSGEFADQVGGAHDQMLDSLGANWETSVEPKAPPESGTPAQPRTITGVSQQEMQEAGRRGDLLSTYPSPPPSEPQPRSGERSWQQIVDDLPPVPPPPPELRDEDLPEFLRPLRELVPSQWPEAAPTRPRPLDDSDEADEVLDQFAEELEGSEPPIPPRPPAPIESGPDATRATQGRLGRVAEAITSRIPRPSWPFAGRRGVGTVPPPAPPGAEPPAAAEPPEEAQPVLPVAPNPESVDKLDSILEQWDAYRGAQGDRRLNLQNWSERQLEEKSGKVVGMDLGNPHGAEDDIRGKLIKGEVNRRYKDIHGLINELPADRKERYLNRLRGLLTSEDYQNILNYQEVTQQVEETKNPYEKWSLGDNLKLFKELTDPDDPDPAAKLAKLRALRKQMLTDVHLQKRYDLVQKAITHNLENLDFNSITPTKEWLDSLPEQFRNQLIIRLRGLGGFQTQNVGQPDEQTLWAWNTEVPQGWKEVFFNYFGRFSELARKPGNPWDAVRQNLPSAPVIPTAPAAPEAPTPAEAAQPAPVATEVISTPTDERPMWERSLEENVDYLLENWLQDDPDITYAELLDYMERDANYRDSILNMERVLGQIINQEETGAVAINLARLPKGLHPWARMLIQTHASEDRYQELLREFDRLVGGSTEAESGPVLTEQERQEAARVAEFRRRGQVQPDITQSEWVQGLKRVPPWEPSDSIDPFEPLQVENLPRVEAGRATAVAEAPPATEPQTPESEAGRALITIRELVERSVELGDVSTLETDAARWGYNDAISPLIIQGTLGPSEYIPIISRLPRYALTDLMSVLQKSLSAGGYRQIYNLLRPEVSPEVGNYLPLPEPT